MITLSAIPTTKVVLAGLLRRQTDRHYHCCLIKSDGGIANSLKTSPVLGNLLLWAAFFTRWPPSHFNSKPFPFARGFQVVIGLLAWAAVGMVFSFSRFHAWRENVGPVFYFGNIASLIPETVSPKFQDYRLINIEVIS